LQPAPQRLDDKNYGSFTCRTGFKPSVTLVQGGECGNGTEQVVPGGTPGNDLSRFQSVQLLPCNVQVDKQVSCDGGVTFVDSGFVTANDDGTISCAGVVGTNVEVRYAAKNPNDFTLFGCTATDTNTGITNTPISFHGTCGTNGLCDDGVTACTSNTDCPFPIGGTIILNPITQTCSVSLAANEPDTVTLNCFCTAAKDINFQTS